jgi:hypothetical protein
MPTTHSKRGWHGRKVDMNRDYEVRLIKKVPVQKIALSKIRFAVK